MRSTVVNGMRGRGVMVESVNGTVVITPQYVNGPGLPIVMPDEMGDRLLAAVAEANEEAKRVATETARYIIMGEERKKR